MFDWYEKVRCPLTPPSGKYGVVIARDIGQDQIRIGFGYSGEEFFVSISHGPSTLQPVISELSRQDYERLVSAIDRPEFKQLGTVFDAGVLDGESYLVRYVEPAGRTDIFLGNPRQSNVPAARAFADALDSVTAMARRLSLNPVR